MGFLRRGSAVRWVGFSVLLVAASCISTVNAELPYITNTVEFGVNTECKTSPHTLSPNKVFYNGETAVNLTCWTRGTVIASNDIWLHTQDSCYVTQFDLSLYNGSYFDLNYCGRSSEDENLTTQDARTQYKSECNITPQISAETISYLPEDTDVTIVCLATSGDTIIDDPIWAKTSNNCYIPALQLTPKPDPTTLDSCGPIPFLESSYHHLPNTTTEIDRRAAALPPSINYLINVTVGEDVAHCRSCPRDKCDVVQTYQFNSEVWLQCLYEQDQGRNVTFWSETIDFCYVKNSEFWQSPDGDYYKWPRCEYFEDGGD